MFTNVGSIGALQLQCIWTYMCNMTTIFVQWYMSNMCTVPLSHGWLQWLHMCHMYVCTSTIKVSKYLAYMLNLVGIYVSSRYLAITWEVCIAVCCVLAHMCKNDVSICHGIHWGSQLVTPWKVGWVWMHWWTQSEQGTSGPTQGCMHVGFPPESMWCHHSITWWCGNVGGYTWCHLGTMQWCIGDMGSCVLHQWCQDKGVNARGEGWFQGPSFGFERVWVLSHNCRGTLMCWGTWFARNTLPSGNTCLVCCFPWSCIIKWSSFSFYNIYLLGWPLGECSPLEKIGVPDNKDHQALSVPREVCNADWGVLIICVAVTVLWHPWVGLDHQPFCRSKCVFIWLHIEWPLLRSVAQSSQCNTDGSAVQCSCCKLLLGNIFREHYLYPEGTASTFRKDQPVSGMWMAWPDTEHWDWYPSTLLYFSSCKNIIRPLCLVWYPGSSVRLA